MLIDEVFKIAITVVASIGGIGVVILGIIKFSANIIADNLARKYDFKLNKEIENYKAFLENKTYISKAKLDEEFQIYRTLSLCQVNMVKETVQLFPTFTKDLRDDYETYKKRHDSAFDAIMTAQDEYASNAPFISEEIYDKLLEIEELCKVQLSDFQDFRLRPDAEEFRKNCSDAYRAAYERSREINEKHKAVLNALRDYLSKLDVSE